jgi:hypothetical protein
MIASLRLTRTLGVAALIALAAATGAGAQTVPAPTPLPAPTPAPSSTATPVPVPVASTTPSPPPTALPTPAVSPTPDPYTYIVPAPPLAATAPADGPQIIDVSLNDRMLHSGGQILVRVRTSPNVVGVEARAMGRFIAIPPSPGAPGTFVLGGAIPGGIPFFLMGKHDIVFAAATADGRQTTLTVPLTLAR